MSENTLIDPTNRTDISGIKVPKNCKENRYYYRHREEILANRLNKKLEDPEYKAKYEEKQRKKKEKEELERKKEENREARKKIVNQILNPSAPGVT